MRVIIQDNLWFHGDPFFSNYQRNGQSIIPVEPLLGRTDSSDMEAKRQELQWLLRYTGRTGSGLVVAQEWIRPGNRIDTNLGPWVELFERHAGRARWCIFYDPILAVRQRNLGPVRPVDFSRPELIELWRSDLDYLENLYFGGPKYWQRDGRPVLYVWAVHSLINFHPIFHEAADRGTYLIGDVFGSSIDPGPVSAVTGFVSALPGRQPRRWDYDEFLGEINLEFETWRTRSSDLGIEFIPAGSLQFDDAKFQAALDPPDQQSPTRVPATNRTDLDTMLTLLKSATDPAGHVFLGTANNWAEGTTCLPTTSPMPRFRTTGIGNYHFEHLDAIRRVLFPDVRLYQGPTVRRREFQSQPALELRDADFEGRLRVRGEHQVAIGKNCRRFVTGQPERIVVRNLDRLRVVWTPS